MHRRDLGKMRVNEGKDCLMKWGKKTLNILCVSSFLDIYTDVGANATLVISGASTSQCKTSDGRGVAECNGDLVPFPLFSKRVKGVCEEMILGPVEDSDFQHYFICDDLDHGKTYQYRLISKNQLNCSGLKGFVTDVLG